MKCVRCGSETRMQVQAVISAPGELAHQLSKRNIRRKDVFLMGVLWETADFICTNPECHHVYDGYGNYVTNLKKQNELMKDALNKIIEMNRYTAECHYGDANKAEDWACVKTARGALKDKDTEDDDH